MKFWPLLRIDLESKKRHVKWKRQGEGQSQFWLTPQQGLTMDPLGIRPPLLWLLRPLGPTKMHRLSPPLMVTRGRRLRAPSPPNNPPCRSFLAVEGAVPHGKQHGKTKHRMPQKSGAALQKEKARENLPRVPPPGTPGGGAQGVHPMVKMLPPNYM